MQSEITRYDLLLGAALGVVDHEKERDFELAPVPGLRSLDLES